jgi:hypothetical protein
MEPEALVYLGLRDPASEIAELAGQRERRDEVFEKAQLLQGKSSG